MIYCQCTWRRGAPVDLASLLGDSRSTRRQSGEIQKFFHGEVGENLHVFFTSRLQNHVFFSCISREGNFLVSSHLASLGDLFSRLFHFLLSRRPLRYVYPCIPYLIEIAGAHVLWLEVDMILVSRRIFILF